MLVEKARSYRRAFFIWTKVACGAFVGHSLRCRWQKAWLLPPALRGYALLRRDGCYALPPRDSTSTALTSLLRRAQYCATGGLATACLSFRAVLISVRRRSMRPSTV